MTACNNNVPLISPKLIDGTFRQKFRSSGAADARGIALQGSGAREDVSQSHKVQVDKTNQGPPKTGLRRWGGTISEWRPRTRLEGHSNSGSALRSLPLAVGHCFRTQSSRSQSGNHYVDFKSGRSPLSHRRSADPRFIYNQDAVNPQSLAAMQALDWRLCN
jgi:hypothetical protein